MAYISTEGQFPSSRLQQLLRHERASNPALQMKQAADRILIQHITDVVSLPSIATFTHALLFTACE